MREKGQEKMKLEKNINTLPATDMVKMTETINSLVEQVNEAKDDAWRIRQPNKSYSVGDKVIVPGVANFDRVLRCESSGVTANSAFPKDYGLLKVGDIINDGSVTWSVVNLSSGGGGGGTGGAVTSVNGKTGDVALVAKDVAAMPDTHDEDTNAHKTLFDNHRKEFASTGATGHVKVDGNSITVDANGKISAVGGLPIGAVFAFPSATPPAGAYLLNGQTIANCKTLYPKFYNWLINSGVRRVDEIGYEQEKTATGVCGAFVVSSNGSVRLPCIINGTVWGADSSNVGRSLAAGLPNITGTFSGVGQALHSTPSPATLTGAFSRENTSNNPADGVKVGNDSTAQRDDVFNFDASRSSDVYGKSDTVQPAAARFAWCIQVFNASTALSEQQSAQLASLLQAKVNTDFSNVAENLDFIIKHEEATDGSWWYDLYRSGKVVQGGVTPIATVNAKVTLTFPVEMANTNYTPLLTNYGVTGFYTSPGGVCHYTASNLTTTGFDYWGNTANFTKQHFWRVEGKAATK